MRQLVLDGVVLDKPTIPRQLPRFVSPPVAQHLGSKVPASLLTTLYPWLDCLSDRDRRTLPDCIVSQTPRGWAISDAASASRLDHLESAVCAEHQGLSG